MTDMLTTFEYAEKAIELITTKKMEDGRGSLYILAPLPKWTKKNFELRDKLFKYANMPNPNHSPHRWYLKDEWDEILSKILGEDVNVYKKKEREKF